MGFSPAVCGEGGEETSAHRERAAFQSIRRGLAVSHGLSVASATFYGDGTGSSLTPPRPVTVFL